MSREAFEKWMTEVMLLPPTWEAARNCYSEFPAHLAWKAWQAARTEEQRKWIAVSERKPENYDTILIVDGDGIRSTGFWNGSVWLVDVVDPIDGMTITPTHWMPLPDAPVSPPLPKPSCTWRTGCTYEADCMAAGRCLGDRSPPQHGESK